MHGVAAYGCNRHTVLSAEIGTGCTMGGGYQLKAGLFDLSTRLYGSSLLRLLDGLTSVDSEVIIQPVQYMKTTPYS